MRHFLLAGYICLVILVAVPAVVGFVTFIYTGQSPFAEAQAFASFFAAMFLVFIAGLVWGEL